MHPQYLWPAGTPVMLLGMETRYPSDHNLRHNWKSVMAGHLEESFSPGSSVILDDARMPGAIPARGWQTYVVHRAYERGVPLHLFSDERREALIHDAWKNMFLFSANASTEPVHGCRSFFMVQSSAEVAQTIGGENTSLCERLQGKKTSDFPALLGLVPEIVSSMNWFLGGQCDARSAKIDRAGKIIFPE